MASRSHKKPQLRSSTRIPPPWQRPQPTSTDTSFSRAAASSTNDHDIDKNKDDEENDDQERGQQDESSGENSDNDSSSVERHSSPCQQGEQFSSSRGLSYNLQRQLITDIALYGGLEFVCLRDLCNSKPDIYGLQNSGVRRKIQNKVHQWKLLKPEAYRRLLNQLNISIASQHSSELLTKSASFNSPPPLSSPPVLSPFSSDRTKQVSTSYPGGTPRSTRLPHNRAAAKSSVQLSPTSCSHLSRYHCSTNMVNNNSSTTRHSSPVEDVEADDLIKVNLTFPERNREVQIYSFENLLNPISGDIINGFHIVLPADVRDVALNLYRAEIVHDNEIVIYMPSLPFSVSHDSVQRHLQLAALDIGCLRCKEAQDIVVQDIKLSPARSIRKLCLRFPDHIVLANMSSAVSPVLTGEEQPFAFTSQFGSSAIQSVGCNMTWKVASVERHRKVAGAASRDPATKLSEMFSRMIGTTSTRMSSTTSCDQQQHEQRTSKTPHPVDPAPWHPAQQSAPPPPGINPPWPPPIPPPPIVPAVVVVAPPVPSSSPATTIQVSPTTMPSQAAAEVASPHPAPPLPPTANVLAPIAAAPMDLDPSTSIKRRPPSKQQLAMEFGRRSSKRFAAAVDEKIVAIVPSDLRKFSKRRATIQVTKEDDDVNTDLDV